MSVTIHARVATFRVRLRVTRIATATYSHICMDGAAGVAWTPYGVLIYCTSLFTTPPSFKHFQSFGRLPDPFTLRER